MKRTPTKAHEVLTGATKWTQGTLARDVDGKPCAPWGTSAACHCISGACILVYGTGVDWHEVSAKIFREINAKNGGQIIFIPQWNDAPERTFVQVRALLLKLDL